MNRKTLVGSRPLLLSAWMAAAACGCTVQYTADGPAVSVNEARRGGAPPPSEEIPTPVGRDWIFTWLDDFKGPLPSPPPVAGFIMTKEGGRLTGTTACNRMGSGYVLDIDDGTLRFTGLTNTRMMCDRVAADTEEAVLEAMIETDSYRLDGNTLELLSEGEVEARLTAP